MKKVMLLVSKDMCDILQRELDSKYITLPCSDLDTGEKLLAQNPNILIMDLFLPGGNSMTFLKVHASILPPVVLVLTVFADEALLQELSELGVYAVALIPCRISYLKKLLTDLQKKRTPPK